MSTRCLDELETAFQEDSAALFANLQPLLRKEWPEAMVQVSDTKRADLRSTTLSLLYRQSGDNVELQFELCQIDDASWVEATLFLGQSTLVTLNSQCWSSTPSRPEELRSTIRDVATFMQPRFLQLARSQA
jgi:hypothetical protein